MDDKRITAEEILAEIDIDVDQMAQKIADAINNAQAGAIINQREELKGSCRDYSRNDPFRPPSAESIITE